jgi:hypothetical protein
MLAEKSLHAPFAGEESMAASRKLLVAIKSGEMG